MHSTVAVATAHAVYRGDIDGDKVSMRHIRLSLPHQGISAKVASFRTADQVLLSWTRRAGGVLECEFEVVYDDGHTLAGEFRFKDKAGTRPALMVFVRKAITSMYEGRSKATLVRNLCNDPHEFLTDYATDDF